MSVIIFAEFTDGKVKNAFEAVTYGKKTAELMGTSCKAFTLGLAENANELGAYGAEEVYNISDEVF